jgi:hypothetical protein
MDDQLFDTTELDGTQTLPPAGAARREELARRADALEQKIEEIPTEQESIPHDHDAIRPERQREIQHAIHSNYLQIGVDHPYLAVKWVNWKNLEGDAVWRAKSEGWVTATTAEFPEAEGLQKVDGTIRVADVLLMCMRKDLHMQLELKQKNKRLRQQYGVEAKMHDLAARNPRAFAGVSTPEIGQTGHLGPAANASLQAMEQRSTRANQAARALGVKHIGERMKSGPIPGVPIK